MLGALGLELVPWWTVWGVVLVLRLALLPGALRPRHERATPPASGWQRGLAPVPALAAAAAIWIAFTDPGAPRDAQAFVAPAQAAAAVLTLQALAARTRRPPWVGAALSALGAVAFALLARLVAAESVAPLLLGALWIPTGAIVHRRTADRRAAALAIVGALGLVVFEPFGVLG
jgi:hypothetical protein